MMNIKIWVCKTDLWNVFKGSCYSWIDKKGWTQAEYGTKSKDFKLATIRFRTFWLWRICLTMTEGPYFSIKALTNARV